MLDKRSSSHRRYKLLLRTSVTCTWSTDKMRRLFKLSCCAHQFTLPTPRRRPMAQVNARRLLAVQRSHAGGVTAYTRLLEQACDCS